MNKGILFITIMIACGVLDTHGQSRDELFGKAAVTDTAKWENRAGHILLKEVYAEYDKMAKAAAKEGVNLYIVSAYRSFAHQKRIWERKWNDASRAKMTPKQRAVDILKYSSMPSTSRHHWGTDFDLVSVSPTYFESGEGKKIYRWLVDNAGKYGFFQPYTQGRTKGYATEKWHWSYALISSIYEKQYIKTVKNSDITGFSGSGVASEIDVVNGWVKLK